MAPLGKKVSKCKTLDQQGVAAKTAGSERSDDSLHIILQNPLVSMIVSTCVCIDALLQATCICWLAQSSPTADLISSTVRVPLPSVSRATN